LQEKREEFLPRKASKARKREKKQKKEEMVTCLRASKAQAGLIYANFHTKCWRGLFWIK